jgi:hypothetical protein
VYQPTFSEAQTANSTDLQLEPPCSEFKSLTLFDGVVKSIVNIQGVNSEEYLKQVLVETVLDRVPAAICVCL